MASPGDEPSGKDKQTDPTVRVVPLTELRAIVVELMKEAAEAQKEKPETEDNPGTSRTGRAAFVSQ